MLSFRYLVQGVPYTAEIILPSDNRSKNAKVVIVANGAAYGSESLFNSLRLAIALREQEASLDLRRF